VRNKRNTRHRKPRNILTNDPSLTAWGWAVVTTDGFVLCADCIKTEPSPAVKKLRKADDRVRRIGELARELKRIIDRYKVVYIISELPHGSQNASAAFALGACAAVVQTISEWSGLGVEWYSEADAKKAVSGKRSVAKEDMVTLMEEKYNTTLFGVKWKDQGVADALAVHYVAMQESPTLKFLK
jgi:Holliday junction resolvasome RuvABC endonuclease subunit